MPWRSHRSDRDRDRKPPTHSHPLGQPQDDADNPGTKVQQLRGGESLADLIHNRPVQNEQVLGPQPGQ
jgi:hypothetical protein